MAQTPVKVTKTPTASPGPPEGPIDPWASFRNEMDRLFDRFTGISGAPSLRRMSGMERYEGTSGFTIPPVDITDDDKAYKIAAELPGMSEKDIEVSLTGDMLVLKGEKRQEREEKEKNRYLSERSHGTFQRSFVLPEGIDRDRISAEFSKGVLTLTMPKTPEAQKQQKRIEVKSA
jgi:HSP20 family protein